MGTITLEIVVALVTTIGGGLFALGRLLAASERRDLQSKAGLAESRASAAEKARIDAAALHEAQLAAVKRAEELSGSLREQRAKTETLESRIDSVKSECLRATEIVEKERDKQHGRVNKRIEHAEKAIRAQGESVQGQIDTLERRVLALERRGVDTTPPP